MPAGKLLGNCVDLIEAATGKFVGRVTGFTGFDRAARSSTAGPDGLVAVGTADREGSCASLQRNSSLNTVWTAPRL